MSSREQNQTETSAFFPNDSALLRIAKAQHSSDPAQLTSPLSEEDWTVLYHSSEARNNILRWLKDTLEGKTLEIGAESGVHTSFLCSVGAIVDAYEPNIVFAEFLAAQANNVLKTLPDEAEQYESVVSISHQERFEELGTSGEGLSRMAGYLKSGGQLIVAVENTLAMKHIDDNPTSLQSPISSRSSWAMNRESLIAKLQAVGFEDIQVYYPLPDRFFPVEVIADTAIDSFDWAGRNYELSPLYGRAVHHNLEPTIISRALSQSNNTPLVFNDLLVVARKTAS